MSLLAPLHLILISAVLIFLNLIRKIISILASSKTAFVRLPKSQLPKTPPGPISLPIIGTLHVFLSNRKIRDTFSHLKRNYGPIFKFKLMSYDCVGIADYDLIKEALNNPGEEKSKVLDKQEMF